MWGNMDLFVHGSRLAPEANQMVKGAAATRSSFTSAAAWPSTHRPTHTSHTDTHHSLVDTAHHTPTAKGGMDGVSYLHLAGDTPQHNRHFVFRCQLA